MTNSQLSEQERFAALVQTLSKEPSVTCGEPNKTFGRSVLRFDQKIFAMFLADRQFAVKLFEARVEELEATGEGKKLKNNNGHFMKDWIAVTSESEGQWLLLAQEAMGYCKEPPRRKVRTSLALESAMRPPDIWEDLPALFTSSSTDAKRAREFFIHHLRNSNTRKTYARSAREFAAWCGQNGLSKLAEIEPPHVAAYIAHLQQRLAPPSLKLHLAALRMLFDWLVAGHVMPINPASSVCGTRTSSKKQGAWV